MQLDSSPASSWAVFRIPAFTCYAAARFFALFALQISALVLGQYVYELTHDPLYLGYLGLAFFLPKIAFTLLAGHVADRHNRRSISVIARLIQSTVVLGWLAFTSFSGALSPVVSLIAVYVLVLAMGSATAFDAPASQALLPDWVPERLFHQAVTWNATFFQAAFVLGPLCGGFLYSAVGRVGTMGGVACLLAISVLLLTRPRMSFIRHATQPISWQVLFSGVRYVFQTKILLAILSLDLFAVLFGGAVALMPIIAHDVLHVGPNGLGILRAAPALGAALMAIVMTRLTRHAPLRHAGWVLLLAVALFGLATIGFGLSTAMGPALLFLVIAGASDMVSVIIRGVLVQTETPVAMRGRVSAVNAIFIGASNELGEFESGALARAVGTVPAIVLGGTATVIVVFIWAWRFPELRGKYC